MKHIFKIKQRKALHNVTLEPLRFIVLEINTVSTKDVGHATQAENHKHKVSSAVLTKHDPIDVMK